MTPAYIDHSSNQEDEGTRVFDEELLKLARMAGRIPKYLLQACVYDAELRQDLHEIRKLGYRLTKKYKKRKG